MYHRFALPLFIVALVVLTIGNAERLVLKKIDTYSQSSYPILDSKVDTNGDRYILYRITANFTIGSKTFAPPRFSFVLAKYAPDGDTVLWAAGPTSLTSTVSPVNIRLTTDGVVVTASMDVGTLEIGTQTFTNVDTTIGGKEDVIVVKYNSAGDFQWGTQLKGQGLGTAEETHILPDNSLVLLVLSREKTVSIGATVLFTSVHDSPGTYYLLKLTAQGEYAWVQYMDSSNNLVRRSVLYDDYLYISGRSDKEITMSGITISSTITYGYYARVKVSDGSVSYLKAMEASTSFDLHRLEVMSSGLHLIGEFQGTSEFGTSSKDGTRTSLVIARAVLTTGELDQHQVLTTSSFVKYVSSLLNDNEELFVIVQYTGSVQNVSFTTPESNTFYGAHLITKYLSATNTFANWIFSFDESTFPRPAKISNWNYFGDGLIFTVTPELQNIVIAGTTVTKNGGAIFKISGEDGSVQWVKTFQSSSFSFKSLLLDREQEILHMAISFGNGATSFDTYSYPQTTTPNGRSLIATLSPSGDFAWVSSLFHGSVISISNLFQNTDGDIFFIGFVDYGQSKPLKIGVIESLSDLSGEQTRQGIFSKSTKLCFQFMVNQCATCLDESTCAKCTEPKYTGDLCDQIASNCYGKFSTNSQVCSGRGTCVGTDTCHCRVGWAGFNCQRSCSYCVSY